MLQLVYCLVEILVVLPAYSLSWSRHRLAEQRLLRVDWIVNVSVVRIAAEHLKMLELAQACERRMHRGMG